MRDTELEGTQGKEVASLHVPGKPGDRMSSWVRSGLLAQVPRTQSFRSCSFRPGGEPKKKKSFEPQVYPTPGKTSRRIWRWWPELLTQVTMGTQGPQERGQLHHTQGSAFLVGKFLGLRSSLCEMGPPPSVPGERG